MKLEILTPEKKVYADTAYAIQLPGVDGLFEILDNHAPLVGTLTKGKIKVMKDKNNAAEYSIESGFVEILNNKATILVDAATSLI